jgi:hypothetical protein
MTGRALGLLFVGFSAVFCFSGGTNENPGKSQILKESSEKFPMRMIFRAGPMNSEDVNPYDVQPVAPKNIDGPHIRAGKAAKWIIDNTVKLNGWSFTGWSKTGIDEEFHPWRLHVGIISGEIDANIADSMAENRTPRARWEELEEWQRRRTNCVAFGLVFTKRF